MRDKRNRIWDILFSDLAQGWMLLLMPSQPPRYHILVLWCTILFYYMGDISSSTSFPCPTLHHVPLGASHYHILRIHHTLFRSLPSSYVRSMGIDDWLFEYDAKSCSENNKVPTISYRSWCHVSNPNSKLNRILNKISEFSMKYVFNSASSLLGEAYNSSN